MTILQCIVFQTFKSNHETKLWLKYSYDCIATRQKMITFINKNKVLISTTITKRPYIFLLKITSYKTKSNNVCKNDIKLYQINNCK